MNFVKGDVVTAKEDVFSQLGRLLVPRGNKGTVMADLGSTGCPRDLQLLRVDFAALRDVYVSNSDVELFK
jgi:hypothetical protein